MLQMLRALLAVLAGAAALLAQANPPHFSFELATVKVAPQNGGLIAMNTDPAMVRYSNITLKNLIAMAYRTDSRLIVGPGWLDSEYYEIAAKLPPETPQARIPLMLQTLLAERFNLALHRETKEQRVYFLVTGKNGPKLKPAAPVDGQQKDTRQIDGYHLTVQLFPGGIRARATSLATFAATLANVAGYRVVDHTRLDGAFDIDLRWTPENSNGTGPDLFTAIQEQLGLKLEPGRGPVEILLIDDADRIPVDN
jgi:uncharacterized protein (TIGR03435 family)